MYVFVVFVGTPLFQFELVNQSELVLPVHVVSACAGDAVSSRVKASIPAKQTPACRARAAGGEVGSRKGMGISLKTVASGGKQKMTASR